MKATLASLLFLIVSYANAQIQKVVFVCEHGAAKSVIAASYFNKLAAERGLNYQAVCRATAPDTTLNQATRAGLRADNIKPNLYPQKLGLRDTVNTERIILFTSLPADYMTATPVEDWSPTENIDGTYEQRRDAIVKKVSALLDSLQKKK